jgi:hypothetical protein
MKCQFSAVPGKVSMNPPATLVDVSALFAAYDQGMHSQGLLVNPCSARVHLNHVIFGLTRAVRTGEQPSLRLAAPNFMSQHDTPEHATIEKSYSTALVNALVPVLLPVVSNLLYPTDPHARTAYDIKVSESYILRLLLNPQGSQR